MLCVKLYCQICCRQICWFTSFMW